MMTFRSKMLAVAILLLSPKSLPAQEQAVKADTIRHSEHYTDDRGREFVRFWYEPLAMDARFVPEMRVEKEGEGKRLTVRSGSYSIDATINQWQALQANMWEISNSSIQYMKTYWAKTPFIDTGYSLFDGVIPIKPYWWRWIL